MTTLSLWKSEQLTPSFLAVNPNGLVPALVASYADDSQITITQSVSILEFLEEVYTDSQRRLLPGIEDMERRSQVRDLVLLLCADLQPPTNMRVRNLVKTVGGDMDTYMNVIISRVFDSFEKMLEKSVWKGKYCVGDELTLADVCLVAAAWGCDDRIDIGKWTRMGEIVARCKEMEEFQLP